MLLARYIEQSQLRESKRFHYKNKSILCRLFGPCKLFYLGAASTKPGERRLATLEMPHFPYVFSMQVVDTEKGKKVGGKRYEAGSRGRSSPDTLGF